MPNYEKQNKIVIIVAVCVGLFFLGGILVFITQTIEDGVRDAKKADNSRDEYVTEYATEPATEILTESPTEPPTEPPTESPTNAKRVYELNETFDDNGVKITFLNYEPFKSEVYDNKDMVRVFFRLENDSKEDITFSILDFDCYINNKSTDFPLVVEDDKIKGFEDVPSGRYTERAIYVEAKTSDNIELEYRGQVFRITK